MAVEGNLLFVLVSCSMILYVFSIKKRPKLLKKISLEDLGLEGFAFLSSFG
jgi:hypothetical protein